jgi:glycosyltransferase involved in cell wall biosynthesis
MFERIIRAASRNVCVAKRMQADMMRIFPFARAVTLYNGINPHPPEIFAVPRPPELAGKQVIFSAGMFNVRKGFPLLIEAFAKIAGKFPDAVLRIAGDGVQRAVIEQTIAAHRVEARVQLLGLMPQARIFQEMAWSDAFALVGWDEPFATVFIEAMGAGKPILTAGDGGINDVVVDRVHGLVVPPKNADAAAEALASLLADSQARETMGRNARTLVENRLTWDANARELLKLFTEAAPPPGSA